MAGEPGSFERGRGQRGNERSVMRRQIRVLALGAVAAAVLAAPTAAMSPPTLNATVGPGFTITLKKGGVKVTKLKRGKYVFKVADKSNIHNFHLTGPGVNKDSGVGKVGNSTWTVTLKAGTYKYVCDPHKTVMKGSFKVT
jgi:plastocyanin